MSKEFSSHLAGKGTKHEFTIRETPQMNGVAERVIRTLMESARSMLIHAGLEKRVGHWAEAINYAAAVRNRVLTRSNKIRKTPFHLWKGYKPDVSRMKVFGSKAYAHEIDSKLTSDFAPKAKIFRYVGLSEVQKGYYV